MDKETSLGHADGVSRSRPIVYSYLRFSRPEQIRGDSLRRQLQASREWAEARGLKLAEPVQDLGVSAFRGTNAASGKLAGFLKLIETKRIAPGSFLVVESLDRLSRAQISEALQLFLAIINAGITIVTLADGHEYRKEKLDLADLVTSLVIMSRANEESATKSMRLKKAWEQKRANASKQILTRRLPGWLELRDGKMIISKEVVAAIREVFEMTARGFGIVEVQKRINAKYRHLIRAEYISRTYVQKLLTERAVLGEYQPCRMELLNGAMRRAMIGDAIRDYYPRIISDELYYAAQRSRKSRRVARGRTSLYVNLFTGLIFNADDGSQMIMQSKRHRLYVSHKAINGIPGAAPFRCLPVACVEIATLLRLSEVTFFPTEEYSDDRLGSFQEQIGDVDAKIEAITKQVVEGGGSPSVVSLLKRLDDRKAALDRAIDEERERQATSTKAVLAKSVERLNRFIGLIQRGELDNDTRFELRGLIASLVARLELSVSKLKQLGNLFRVDAKLRLKDGRRINYRFDCKFRKSSNPSNRGYLTWLWTSATERLEIATDAEGRVYYQMN